jgi:hypothetical protein
MFSIYERERKKINLTFTAGPSNILAHISCLFMQVLPLFINEIFLGHPIHLYYVLLK